MNKKHPTAPEDDEERPSEALNGDAPEPSKRYRMESRQVDSPNASELQTMVNPDPEFDSARKLTNAAKIMALVSLLIGGVFLSSAALIVSVTAYWKAAQMRDADRQDAPSGRLFMLIRSAQASIVVSILALILNAITLAYLAPMIIEAMQTGDYSTLLGTAQQASPSTESSGSSFWG